MGDSAEAEGEAGSRSSSSSRPSRGQSPAAGSVSSAGAALAQHPAFDELVPAAAPVAPPPGASQRSAGSSAGDSGSGSAAGLRQGVGAEDTDDARLRCTIGAQRAHSLGSTERPGESLSKMPVIVLSPPKGAGLPPLLPGWR